MALQKTWRWFGTNDLITLDNLRQIGVEGIVTSLHHIPKGEIWQKSDILKTKTLIEEKGMVWSVVESLPVLEEIKFGSENRYQLIDNYIESLRNLGACGIDTVCYNFMPVIDWIRTDLEYKQPNGADSLYFDFARFVAFEIFILEREEAKNEYPSDVVERALAIGKEMTTDDRKRLVENIILKTQGFVDGLKLDGESDPIKIFKDLLSLYKGIDKVKLRENLKYFLERIIPEAEKAGVRFAIHPDDPPMAVLGLPRIVSTLEDIEWITNCIQSPANGFTFCTGSLSVNPQNNIEEIVTRFSDRIQFVHLRNTHLLENLDFYESGHIVGGVDMFAVLKVLLTEQNRRIKAAQEDTALPMRVDHGMRILSDVEHAYNPGYPLLGRMKGLAEITGLEYGVERMLKSEFG